MNVKKINNYIPDGIIVLSLLDEDIKEYQIWYNNSFIIPEFSNKELAILMNQTFKEKFDLYSSYVLEENDESANYYDLMVSAIKLDFYAKNYNEAENNLLYKQIIETGWFGSSWCGFWYYFVVFWFGFGCFWDGLIVFGIVWEFWYDILCFFLV